jgi:hypothetical protein
MIFFDDNLTVLIVSILLVKHVNLLFQKSYFDRHLIALLSGLQLVRMALGFKVRAATEYKIIATASIVSHMSFAIAVTI